MDSSFKTKKFLQTVVGKRLKNARLKLKYTRGKIEQATTIRRHYIKAIEEEKYERLPASVYTLGFVHKYATFLGLPADEITKIFKANLLAWQNQNNSAFSVSAPRLAPKLVITPKLLGGIFVALLVVGFGGYLWYQLRFITQPPHLVILSPSKQWKTSQSSVVVKGKTVAGAQVLINDELVTQDKEGNFAQEIKLHQGVNNIAVIAQNQFDKQAVELIQILQNPASPSSIDETGSSDNDKRG